MRVSWSYFITSVFTLIFLFLLARFIYRDPLKREYIAKPFYIAMHFFHKNSLQTNLAATQPGLQAPTFADVTRYRYHHGTNLGSVFVLERWMTEHMFPLSAAGQGTSELTAVSAWVVLEGDQDARERFEKHWREYVSDADLDWLRDVSRCTTVRVPIGYFTLGPKFCEGTPFKGVASVYQNAWQAVMDLVKRCNDRGMGVLIDLHALPGGANTGEHSGTNSGKAELWGSKANLDLATKCVCFIAQQTRTMEGVAGIQIINEAESHAKGMYEWYDRVLLELSHIDNTIPIYVSDGWNLNHALGWSQPKNNMRTQPTFNPVVVDTHLYWCFSDADKAKSPQQIVYEVHSTLSELDGKDGSVNDRGAAQVHVGEYSCVLSEETWAKRRDTPKAQLVSNFGVAQSQRYQRRACGSTFWSYRMDWTGGEWGFRPMNEQHAIGIPLSLALPAAELRNRINQAQTQRDFRKGNTVKSHVGYWDKNYPGQPYEHWRFEQGWEVGFADAAGFLGMRGQRGWEGGDKIGMLDLWVLKRLRESGQAAAVFAWEWEAGLRQGVRDFYECVGV
ncbi:Glucan 1,3-beta-glucosidase 3 [Vermiconidia calcicola]|uniref:Glucan 1,3-beta-glucosidase 3 n=1 Tax=Vermiconidia calcicola TaxID=1690605 RepID=A0ACC3NUK7_9PEZI|nr:Glucan 1,3-beta-glucosidase 3 [Vermiconidia calcicola]